MSGNDWRTTQEARFDNTSFYLSFLEYLEIFNQSLPVRLILVEIQVSETSTSWWDQVCKLQKYRVKALGSVFNGIIFAGIAFTVEYPTKKTIGTSCKEAFLDYFAVA